MDRIFRGGGLGFGGGGAYLKNRDKIINVEMIGHYLGTLIFKALLVYFYCIFKEQIKSFQV